MAHFCKLDENNVVIETIVVANEVLLDENGVEQEQKGIDFLIDWSGGHVNWKQTSINTQAGVHILGGTPFRKNYATKGFSYNAERDAFIPFKQYASHILNEETCRWDPPIPIPPDITQTNKDGTLKIIGVHRWNEDTLGWILAE